MWMLFELTCQHDCVQQGISENSKATIDSLQKYHNCKKSDGKGLTHLLVPCNNWLLITWQHSHCHCEQSSFWFDLGSLQTVKVHQNDSWETALGISSPESMLSEPNCASTNTLATSWVVRLEAQLNSLALAPNLQLLLKSDCQHWRYCVRLSDMSIKLFWAPQHKKIHLNMKRFTST